MLSPLNPQYPIFEVSFREKSKRFTKRSKINNLFIPRAMTLCQKKLGIATYVGNFSNRILETKNSDLRGIGFEKLIDEVCIQSDEKTLKGRRRHNRE